MPSIVTCADFEAAAHQIAGMIASREALPFLQRDLNAAPPPVVTATPRVMPSTEDEFDQKLQIIVDINGRYACEIGGYFASGRKYSGLCKIDYVRNKKWAGCELSIEMIRQLVHAADKAGFSYITTDHLANAGVVRAFTNTMGFGTVCAPMATILRVLEQADSVTEGIKASYDKESAPRGYIDFTNQKQRERAFGKLCLPWMPRQG